MRDRVFSGLFEKGKQKGGGKAARARGAPNRKKFTARVPPLPTQSAQLEFLELGVITNQI
jgi:hypothetical protein